MVKSSTVGRNIHTLRMMWEHSRHYTMTVIQNLVPTSAVWKVRFGGWLHRMQLRVKLSHNTCNFTGYMIIPRRIDSRRYNLLLGNTNVSLWYRFTMGRTTTKSVRGSALWTSGIMVRIRGRTLRLWGSHICGCLQSIGHNRLRRCLKVMVWRRRVSL